MGCVLSWTEGSFYTEAMWLTTGATPEANVVTQMACVGCGFFDESGISAEAVLLNWPIFCPSLE